MEMTKQIDEKVIFCNDCNTNKLIVKVMMEGLEILCSHCGNNLLFVHIDETEKVKRVYGNDNCGFKEDSME